MEIIQLNVSSLYMLEHVIKNVNLKRDNSYCTVLSRIFILSNLALSSCDGPYEDEIKALQKQNPKLKKEIANCKQKITKLEKENEEKNYKNEELNEEKEVLTQQKNELEAELNKEKLDKVITLRNEEEFEVYKKYFETHRSKCLNLHKNILSLESINTELEKKEATRANSAQEVAKKLTAATTELEKIKRELENLKTAKSDIDTQLNSEKAKNLELSGKLTAALGTIEKLKMFRTLLDECGMTKVVDVNTEVNIEDLLNDIIKFLDDKKQKIDVALEKQPKPVVQPAKGENKKTAPSEAYNLGKAIDELIEKLAKLKKPKGGQKSV